MNRLDAITEAYTLATGKTTVPAVGQAKRDLLTSFANKYYRDWQTEPAVGEWNSLYAVIGAGTVTTTDTYTLATPINFISQQEGNYVRVKLASGQYQNFRTVRPQQLYQNQYSNVVAKISATQIQFGKAFDSTSNLIGGTIQVPAITKLADLVDDNSLILIDNAAWLPARIAAQYVYSFKSLRDMYDDLMDQANDLMSGMINNNNTLADSYNTGIDYFATIGNVGIDE